MPDHLARGLDNDFDAAFQQMFRVGELELSVAPSKQVHKNLLEILIDGFKALGKQLLHLLSELLDEIFQFLAGLLHICQLSGHKFIPLADFLILFNGGEVHTA